MSSDGSKDKIWITIAVLVPFFLLTGILGWIWLSHRRKRQRRLRHKRRRSRRGSTTYSPGNDPRWGPYQVVRVPVNSSDHGGGISRSGSHVVYVSRSNSHRGGHTSRHHSHRSRHSTKQRRRGSRHRHSRPVLVVNEAPREPPQETSAPAEVEEAVEATKAPKPPQEAPAPEEVAEAVGTASASMPPKEASTPPPAAQS